ncbi:hypothetical protein R1sor_024051 [Riccia sorocarpa]|uniref:Uncharacterized protein n=1 Tax=Riccia sorocarpa TaxID=122646 RepID=A0ABD3GSK5_9MARC
MPDERLTVFSSSLQDPCVKREMASTLDPEEQSNHVEDEDLQDMYERTEDEILYAAYIRYPVSLVRYNQAIMETVNARIRSTPEFSEECWYATEFKPSPRSDPGFLRILVNFVDQNDMKVFKQLRVISFTNESGETFKLYISQDRPEFVERGPNARPVLFFKQLSNSWGINHITNFFTVPLKANKHSPVMQKILNITWLHDKDGSRRKMFIAEAVTFVSDPNLTRLSSQYTFSAGKMITGCTRHRCLLFGRTGHRAIIHDSYAQAGGKRKKREEEVTFAMTAIRADPIISLLERSDRRESWKCDQCSAKGSGYMSCKNHIDSDKHQKMLSALEKIPTEHGNTPSIDKLEPVAPKQKLLNTASSSAQATPPTDASESRPHHTARKLNWEENNIKS